MVRVLVVGLGEVGRPIYELARAAGLEVYGYDVDPSRSVDRLEDVGSPVDFLHVAIPFNSLDGFVETVKHYVSTTSARRVVVHSTVAPGTTRRLYEETGVPAAYSPVRGKHPWLKRHMLFWPKWVAALPREELEAFTQHLRSMGFPVKPCTCSPESLELAKLWETVYRAVMIAAWQELHRAARRLGADPRVVAEFVAEVHRVLGDRPVYYPGYIGGHCLVPNTRILLEAVGGSKLLEAVLESNEKRRSELEDPQVAKEVEELKKIWEQLVPKWYYE